DIKHLLTDIDAFVAVAAEGAEPNRDWVRVGIDLSKHLEQLTHHHENLKAISGADEKNLTEAIKHLNEAEALNTAETHAEITEKVETFTLGVKALWQMVIEHRQTIAILYFTLPSHLGRPVYFEKIYLSAALAMGRTQTILEEMRRKLEIFSGRLMGTLRLKTEGEVLALNLLAQNSHLNQLKFAQRRFKTFKFAVKQRLALKKISAELVQHKQDGELVQAELAQAHLEKNQLLKQTLATKFEKQKLVQLLIDAQQKLGEMGQIKAKLLKVYERKNALFKDVDNLRLRLQKENEDLKQGRKAIKTQVFQLEQSLVTLNKTMAEANDNRHTLQDNLAKAHEKLNQLAAERRFIGAKAARLTGRLTSAETKVVALRAELGAHREQLAKVEAQRHKFREITASLRHNLNLLSQTQAILIKNLRHKNAKLKSGEVKLIGLKQQLTKQKRNFLQGVLAKQKLNADLGSLKLRLGDLETQKHELLLSLE
ncbi:MAG: hypothetical protein ACRCTY_08830, partial [Candidatus Adiutrix sp.]